MKTARRRGFDEFGFAQIDRVELFTSHKIAPPEGQSAQSAGAGKNYAGVRKPLRCFRPDDLRARVREGLRFGERGEMKRLDFLPALSIQLITGQIEFISLRVY